MFLFQAVQAVSSLTTFMFKRIPHCFVDDSIYVYLIHSDVQFLLYYGSVSFLMYHQKNCLLVSFKKKKRVMTIKTYI